MNPRERILVSVLVTVLVGVGGFFFVLRFYLGPLQDVKKRVEEENQAIEKKQAELNQAKADQIKVQRYRQLSLPADSDVARREYQNYLTDLMLRSGFGEGTFVTARSPDTRNSPTLTDKKKPVYTRLTFTAEGSANLKSLVKMLDGFYRTGLLHQIKTLSIQRPTTANAQQKLGDLNINMTIEALILSGADDRKYLLPNIDRRLLVGDVFAGLWKGPIGLGTFLYAIGPTGPNGSDKLAQQTRHYDTIASKDIFYGPPPPPTVKTAEEIDYLEYVYLTDITKTPKFFEASLRDRLRNTETLHLRQSKGFDQFRVMDERGATLLQGQIVKIDQQDVIFREGEKYYVLHVGYNLAESLQKPLSQKQVEVMLETLNPEAVKASLKN